ncbi:PEP-CTERM sorting domain-containing protein [Cerasicoccus maritimus]|uniref:PEP-CTERM sorting domain-containing protein n=1 Tax=Cerasicoccus maritimus TaxID=490089 RepID=UPI002852C64F|nr:PEP-CTERM sorting domain-containing protein [Cerasicoccus maritimus]
MNKLLLLGLTSCFALTLSAQTTIVSSVSDLTFSYSGGASEASSGAGTLAIETSKNSSATANLPSTYQLAVGETMSITLSLELDNLMADTGSSFDIAFADGAEYYQVRLNPVTTTNGITFSEDGDSNLGKFATDATLGTVTNTMTFTLERTGTDEMSLSFSSPTLSSTTRTATNDVSPISTSFGQIMFDFSGNGWNEDFGGSTIVANLSNLSIETTGTVIPEPSTYAMILGAAVLTLGVMRRRS